MFVTRRPRSLSPVFAVGACLVLACVGETAQDGGTTTSGGSTETDTGTDTDTDTGDGDGDPEACEARDEAAFFSYAPFEFGVEPWSADLDWACTVTAVDASAGLNLELDCPEAAQSPIVIDIQSSPAIVTPLVGGEAVSLRFVSEGPFWFNEYLRLDLDGWGHLLTMTNGDGLTPPEPYVFELPVAVEPVYDVCPRQEDFCGQLERLHLRFDLGGDAYDVLDGHHAVLGPPPGVDVWVGEAGHLYEIDCTDTPNEWFRVLIVSGGQE